VFISIVVYFVIDSVRKLLDTPSCICRMLWYCGWVKLVKELGRLGCFSVSLVRSATSILNVKMWI